MRNPRLRVLLVVVAVVGAFVLTAAIPGLTPSGPSPPPPSVPSVCPKSVGLCIETSVTRVVDGDTVEIEDGHRVRLVLVDAPEIGQVGGQAAKDYLTSVCLGDRALIDEDDNQIGGDPAGRILAVVHCAGTNANAALISSGHAVTYQAFCSVSEFGGQAWTGCSSLPDGDCDPAYPDVCIPPPPPDLDCGDIPHRNFRVFPPDPHFFDGDNDGRGCEGA
jgi:micrococcal nuclease